MQASFPFSGSYLKSIKESCKSLRESSHISITESAIGRLLFSPSFLTSFKRVSSDHGLALPLKFSSYLEELNLISILSLLNFASGYRVPLHVKTGRGAWDSIRALVFSLHITSSAGDENLLSAKGMSTISGVQVAELMSINIHTERPHESIPGVVIGELGGPLYELVKLITGVLNETGSILVNSGYPDLGSFVAKTLKESEKEESAVRLETVLEKLVHLLPAFQDMAIVNGHPVYCFKKALFLIHAIVIRFGRINPSPFPIPSTTDSPVFTDNVLPSLLVHLGVIDLSGAPELSRLFPNAGSEESLSALLGPPKTPTANKSPKQPPVAGPILSVEQAYILRAAAVDACELIIKYAHRCTPPSVEYEWLREITLPNLDMWIWAVAKDRPDYRALQRFILTDTIFF
ncbi:hypothetical protein BDQ17DRAFT_1237656 [Cyathus striatus]|nr:hypothetical protein BDQ17DRAFT_1237656 [Cyathus striatus]